MTVTSVSKPAWWKSAVVYQIYPASFKDSNGDGIGDIPGIISKLDYLADLGVNVVWVSPHYASPQVDMGYDISDYEAIHEPYGSLADAERLIAECHARGMKVLFDLVINHTSDQHAWFRESRSSKMSPKRDWYIWRPARYVDNADGTRTRRPPNNWRGTWGGGSAWQWDEVTQEYYLHLFAVEQPDLNWENPDTRRAIYASAIEFWLDRGVDGFRIDTVNMYSKPPGLPDAPVTDPGAETQPAHMLYCNGPRMPEFLAEINAILRRYGAITVGELPHTDNERVLGYVSAAANQLDMVFQFDVVDVGFSTTGRSRFDTEPRNFRLPELKRAIARTQQLIRGTDAWTTAFIENHDQARSISRFASDEAQHVAASGKLLALLETCLSGTLYIYQGQEIGMVNAPADGSYLLDEYKDIGSRLHVEHVLEHVRNSGGGTEDEKRELNRAFAALQYLARDHARIPVSWEASPDGGFSSSADSKKETAVTASPWMKPHPRAPEINVAAQLNDADSVLSFWKRMLRLRREREAVLVYGDFRLVGEEDQNLFVFVKDDHRGGVMLVVLNFANSSKRWELPSAEEMGLHGKEGKKNTLELRLLVSTASGDRKNKRKVEEEELAPFEGRLYEVTV